MQNAVWDSDQRNFYKWITKINYSDAIDREGSETLENEGFVSVCPPQAPKNRVFGCISEEKLITIPPLVNDRSETRGNSYYNIN